MIQGEGLRPVTLPIGYDTESARLDGTAALKHAQGRAPQDAESCLRQSKQGPARRYLYTHNTAALRRQPRLAPPKGRIGRKRRVGRGARCARLAHGLARGGTPEATGPSRGKRRCRWAAHKRRLARARVPGSRTQPDRATRIWVSPCPARQQASVGKGCARRSQSLRRAKLSAAGGVRRRACWSTPGVGKGSVSRNGGRMRWQTKPPKKVLTRALHQFFRLPPLPFSGAAGGAAW